MKQYIFGVILALSFILLASQAFAADPIEVVVTRTGDNTFIVTKTENVLAIPANQNIDTKTWKHGEMVVYIDQMDNSIIRIDAEIAKLQTKRADIVSRQTEHNNQLYQAELQGVTAKAKNGEVIK